MQELQISILKIFYLPDQAHVWCDVLRRVSATAVNFRKKSWQNAQRPISAKNI